MPAIQIPGLNLPQSNEPALFEVSALSLPALTSDVYAYYADSPGSPDGDQRMSAGRDTEDDSPTVLLVGTNPRDARVVACGLEREDASMDVASDVRSAIDRLTTASEAGTEADLPALVILDLTTDPDAGLTVLTAIRASPRLRTLPTIVLVEETGPVTAAPDCVRTAYEQGVNGHIPKPADVEQFADAVQEMATVWFSRIALPPEVLCSDSTSVSYD